jgi:hypothetical protein
MSLIDTDNAVERGAISSNRGATDMKQKLSEQHGNQKPVFVG